MLQETEVLEANQILKEDGMRTKILCVVFLSAGTVALAAQKIEPLNVKLGLWEMTMTLKTSGQLPLPEAYLSKLTPEQRAKLEADMKARSSAHEHTQTYKTCLTKERVTFDEEDKNCTRTILTSTSSKIAAKLACTQQEVQINGTLEFEALTPRALKGLATWSRRTAITRLTQMEHIPASGLALPAVT
jgi:Spy/CpxP family protein refolding chaperone